MAINKLTIEIQNSELSRMSNESIQDMLDTVTLIINDHINHSKNSRK